MSAVPLTDPLRRHQYHCLINAQWRPPRRHTPGIWLHYPGNYI
ncbi:MAG: hypothetical protein ACLQUY_27115 [Ktedonobacterales bacterium]